jgi:hypothetical protein
MFGFAFSMIFSPKTQNPTQRAELYLAFLRHAFVRRGKERRFSKKIELYLLPAPSARSVHRASGPPLRARSVEPLISVVARSDARSQLPADTSGSEFGGGGSDTTGRTVNEGVQLRRAVGRWHPLLLPGGADCSM